MDQLHQRLGHLGQSSVLRTLPSAEGVKLSSRTFPEKCEPCELGKSTRGNTPKSSNTEVEILEVVEADIQGPFPAIAIDGTCEVH